MNYTLGILAAASLVLVFAIMVRVQYGYISQLRGQRHKTGSEQNTYYEKMTFEEEQLHYNQQGGFWPASLVASIIYKARHKKAAH
ncbi:hypothetical protein J2Z69_001553 [Paenibacillus shirakamiensis]|uniref:DUF3949 domain-containing protein n=1 Tax=Paenibacillus shirakamiensis TaxID=1265935 RepID=A0ABS4JFP5_9BACL|nr:DUF3949 domain-containing protein [Paenibacillus shirakamiensis]MBP2000522.1 hypothetical protein [Paenibacillus shirakamiensis]